MSISIIQLQPMPYPVGLTFYNKIWDNFLHYHQAYIKSENEEDERKNKPKVGCLIVIGKEIFRFVGYISCNSCLLKNISKEEEIIEPEKNLKRVNILFIRK